MAGFGAFGKMPALGDFFRLDVASGFVEPWDRWLQQTITALRAHLGARWDDCFNSAPLWRFTLAPGLAGAGARQGVLMPSVDRVGRQYPLTLLATLPGNPPAPEAHFAAHASFAALEDVALACLEDGMTREGLVARLRALPAVAPPAPAHVARGPGAVMVTSGATPCPAGVLAAEALAQGLRAPSLWSAITENGTRLLVTEGLPAPEQALALFDLDAPLWRATG